jgi:hypothetical protein
MRATTEHYPTASWWTEGDFFDRARAEQARMRRSRFGQDASLLTSADFSKERPARRATTREDDDL